MNIKELAGKIAKFEGIKRKYPIAEIILPLTQSLANKYPQLEILRSFGEDSAVLGVSDVSDSHYLLFAMDGMWSKLIDADPEIAGYFGVLVNVNDIICKGGIPIAVLDMLAYKDEDIGRLLIKGMVFGSKKFNVPIVGGHLHPKAELNSLSIAILGVVPRNEVILSSTAQVGDDILIALDLDGKFHLKFQYAWDTTSHKPPAQVQSQGQTMREIASKHLAHAAKDISNPGLVGTLGMLLDASNKGGILNVKEIPIIDSAPLEQWLCMYPGFGMVLTCDPVNAKDIIKVFEKKGIAAAVCGKVDKSHELLITDSEETELTLNFRRNYISGSPHQFQS
ncbi:MAG: AIR synthase related protein [Candidatus Helarchaeota archaeon]